MNTLNCQKETKKGLTKKGKPMYVMSVNTFHEGNNNQRLRMVGIFNNVHMLVPFSEEESKNFKA